MIQDDDVAQTSVNLGEFGVTNVYNGAISDDKSVAVFTSRVYADGETPGVVKLCNLSDMNVQPQVCGTITFLSGQEHYPEAVVIVDNLYILVGVNTNPPMMLLSNNRKGSSNFRHAVAESGSGSGSGGELSPQGLYILKYRLSDLARIQKSPNIISTLETVTGFLLDDSSEFLLAIVPNDPNVFRIRISDLQLVETVDTTFEFPMYSGAKINGNNFFYASYGSSEDGPLAYLKYNLTATTSTTSTTTTTTSSTSTTTNTSTTTSTTTTITNTSTTTTSTSTTTTSTSSMTSTSTSTTEPSTTTFTNTTTTTPTSSTSTEIVSSSSSTSSANETQNSSSTNNTETTIIATSTEDQNILTNKSKTQTLVITSDNTTITSPNTGDVAVVLVESLASPSEQASVNSLATISSVTMVSGAAAAQALRSLSVISVINTKERCELQIKNRNCQEDGMAISDRGFPESFFPPLKLNYGDEEMNRCYGLPSRRGAIIANVFLGPIFILILSLLFGLIRRKIQPKTYTKEVSIFAAGRTPSFIVVIIGSLGLDGVFSAAMVLMSVPSVNGGDVALAIFGMLISSLVVIIPGILLVGRKNYLKQMVMLEEWKENNPTIQNLRSTSRLEKQQKRQREEENDEEEEVYLDNRKVKINHNNNNNNSSQQQERESLIVKYSPGIILCSKSYPKEYKHLNPVYRFILGDNIWSGDFATLEAFRSLFAKNRGLSLQEEQEESDSLLTIRRMLATWSLYFDIALTALSAFFRGWATSQPCDADRNVHILLLMVSILSFGFVLIIQSPISPMRRCAEILSSLLLLISTSMLVSVSGDNNSPSSSVVDDITNLALAAALIGVISSVVLLLFRRVILPLKGDQLVASPNFLFSCSSTNSSFKMKNNIKNPSSSFFSIFGNSKNSSSSNNMKHFDLDELLWLPARSTTTNNNQEMKSMDTRKNESNIIPSKNVTIMPEKKTKNSNNNEPDMRAIFASFYGDEDSGNQTKKKKSNNKNKKMSGNNNNNIKTTSVQGPSGVVDLVADLL